MLISRWLFKKKKHMHTHDRHLEAVRDNAGQMWPTDPRHSWWKRNRCCGSLGGCRVWTPGSESGARILPSETSCPPSERRGRQEEKSQSYPVGLRDGESRERGAETDREEMKAAAALISNRCTDVTHLSCHNPDPCPCSIGWDMYARLIITAPWHGFKSSKKKL